MIYLNHAATSYPKPQSVKEAFMNATDSLPSGQFRSAGSFENGEIFGKCRKKLSQILGISDPEQIYFTAGSTEALNDILYGLEISANQIITTATEHNSVLRPLYNLVEIAGEPIIVPCNEAGFVPVEWIENIIIENLDRHVKINKDSRVNDNVKSDANIHSGIKAIVINHCSNVTGAVQDLKAIGDLAEKYGILFIVDVSQSAGCMPLELENWKVSAAAFTGHKGLRGLQGTGGFYVKKGIELRPLKYGGTGKDSRVIRYDDGNYEYETGTQNAPGIAALLAACEDVIERDPKKIHEIENEKIKNLLEELDSIQGLKIIGRNLKIRGPVISLLIPGMKPADVAYILQSSYEIVTRAGLQCAPLIHHYIGSGEEGTLRISISDETTTEEIEELVKALQDICKAIMTC